MSESIVAPRLDLVSMSADFLRAALAGQTKTVEALLGARLPGGWPTGDEPLLRRRLAQLDADPSVAPWLLRAMVLRDAPGRAMVGGIGFHAAPDERGAVEVGYRVYPPFQRRGFAMEAVRALFGWAADRHGIQHFIASVSPTNTASLAIVRRLGFRQTGSRMDEEDGLELVFELHGFDGAQPSRPYTPDNG